ncbi:WXG100 family type VII secretion target [Krasilnikovia sp. MM14-A1004]|uniref:WXG100 family type VII secretion target n=1 Tax=Krasilnikovia sp. MM14-A1004 TaxID=3373541 RepID=UPI00399D26C7
MTNPLVAQSQSSTTWYTGLGLVEDAADVANGIKNDSWVDGTLGGVGGSLDTLGLMIDPIGTLVSWGVSWLMEHVKPLKDALDWLAGNPDEISAHAATWENVAKYTADTRAQYAEAVKPGTASWLGASGDAYREHAGTHLSVMEGISNAAHGISYAVQGAGLLVGLVRGIVRDLIAEFIGTLAARLPQWLAEEGVTLGLATPVVVGQVAALVAKWVNKIQHFVRALINSLRKLTPMLHRLGEIFTGLKNLLNKLSRANPLGGGKGGRGARGGKGSSGSGGPGSGGGGGGGGPGKGHFGNDALRDGPPFDEEYDSILASMDLNRADHDALRLSAADDLTDPQRKEVIDVRDRMTVNNGQVMTKVLHPDSAHAYLDNLPSLNGKPFNPDEVGGFVARGKDVADLRTPSQLRDGLALDDKGAGWTPIKEDADHALQLRYQQPRDEAPPIPYGGRDEAVAEHMKNLSGNERPVQGKDPFLGTGYTAGSGIPEFLPHGTQLTGRAEIWKINRDGTESLVGVFDKDTKQWTRIAQ